MYRLVEEIINLRKPKGLSKEEQGAETEGLPPDRLEAEIMPIMGGATSIIMLVLHFVIRSTMGMVSRDCESKTELNLNSRRVSVAASATISGVSQEASLT